MRGMLPSLALSAIVPFVVFQVLTAQGASIILALTLSGIFPGAVGLSGAWSAPAART